MANDLSGRIGFDDATLDEEREPTDLRAEPVYYGPHRVCFELASGGMATVFLARTEGPGGFERLVALKRVHTHLANDAQFINMFVDEARIASQISHPHVCSVYDFGQARGTYYIAMQYLVGEPLTRVLETLNTQPALAAESRSTAHLLRLLADACEGLHAAHEVRDPRGNLRHVIHRDVSPQNLVVTYAGQISVVDFGIATAVDRYQKTKTGHARGKMGYMAPEQFRGAEIDRRVDVWAAGVVVWESLVRKRLFARPTPADTVIAVLHEDPPPPASIRPGLPRALDAIVARALARDPEKRFATTRELGRALARVASELGATTAADTSEWMTELFPTGEARRRAIALLATDSTDVGLPKASTASTKGVDVLARRGSGVTKLALAFLLGAGAAALLIKGQPDVQPSGAAEQPDAAGRSAQVARPAADPRPTEPIVPEPATDAGAAHETAEAGPSPIAAEIPTASPSKRPAALAPGTLTIVTPSGWATVAEQGRPLGQTPLRIELSAGVHTLDVRFGDAPPAKHVAVRVTPGRARRVVVMP